MKKIFIIFVMLMGGLVSVFLMPVVAYADDTYTYPPIPEHDSSLYPNHVIYEGTAVSGDKCTYLLLYDSDVADEWQALIWVDGYGKYMFSRCNNMFAYQLSADGSTWNYAFSGTNTYCTVSVDKILFCSNDVIYHNPDSEQHLSTVFTRAPIHWLVAGLPRAQIVETVTRETIGLIPLMVGLVILALALWKGLASLWNLLRTL